MSRSTKRTAALVALGAAVLSIEAGYLYKAGRYAYTQMRRAIMGEMAGLNAVGDMEQDPDVTFVDGREDETDEKTSI